MAAAQAAEVVEASEAAGAARAQVAAAARAGVAAANFVVQCSYLENHGHFVVHSVRTHSVWLKRTESEHYHTPRRPLHSDLENVRLSTTSDTDGRHQTCAPLFSLPCMLGSRTLATRRCRAAAVFIHSFIQHHQLASRA